MAINCVKSICFHVPGTKTLNFTYTDHVFVSKYNKQIQFSSIKYLSTNLGTCLLCMLLTGKFVFGVPANL